MTFEELVSRVREACGVASSYEDETIPALVNRCVNRLLRDYHFPKAVKQQDFTNLFLNSQEYTLPDGFKAVLEARFYNPLTAEWAEEPLEKVNGRILPSPRGYPAKYWLQGTKLITDVKLPSDMVGFTLQLFYESMDAASNRDWFITDFESAIYYFACVLGSAEFRKPEVAQIYGPLWADERESLAIYLNELEWDDVQITMREARTSPRLRYPAGWEG